MPLFEPAEPPQSSTPWAPAFACVLAAAITAALLCPEPLPRTLTPGEGLFRALLLVCLVGAATALAAHVSSASTWAYAGHGVWFAPLAIFVAQGHSWAILGAGVLGAATARLARLAEVEDDVATESPGQLYAFAAVVAMKLGVAAQAVGYTTLAAVLAGIGCFVVAAIAPRVRSQQWDPAPARLRAGFAVQGLGAAALATLALVRVPVPWGIGEGRGRSEQAAARVAAPAKDLHSAAILLPDLSRHTPLVAPPPLTRTRASLGRAAEPLVIEFAGEYWILSHWTLLRPKNALTVRATPIDYDFANVDESNVLMRAFQRLDTPIDLGCCGVIEMIVRSTDAEPELIGMEVVLSDSSVPRGNLPLGLQRLPAKTDAATLRFAIPAQRGIAQFDRIRVDLHLYRPRHHRSARIAIERFVLLPSGF